MTWRPNYKSGRPLQPRGTGNETLVQCPAPLGLARADGHCPGAAKAGASTHKIKQTTGHRTDASLSRYIRDVDLFDDAAAA